MTEYTEAKLREWANHRVAGNPKVFAMTWQERRDAAEMAFQELKANPERCAMLAAMDRALLQVVDNALRLVREFSVEER